MTDVDPEFEALYKRARALHDAHPDWSDRMTLAAASFGEDSEQFKGATRSRDDLTARLKNTAWQARVREARHIITHGEDEWADIGYEMAEALAGHERLGQLARRVERTGTHDRLRAALGLELALKVLALDADAERVESTYSVRVGTEIDLERPTANDIKYALVRGGLGVDPDYIAVEERPS